jgi:hypothetical protein
MKSNKSPFEPNRNPHVGMTQREMNDAIEKNKENDRIFEKKIKKLMKKWKPRD